MNEEDLRSIFSHAYVRTFRNTTIHTYPQEIFHSGMNEEVLRPVFSHTYVLAGNKLVIYTRRKTVIHTYLQEIFHLRE